MEEVSKELEALERIYKSATNYATKHKKSDIELLRKALTPPHLITMIGRFYESEGTG